MNKAYLLGAVLGFGGALAGANAFPWVDHPRVASATTVVPNGGRAERFVIRLPADRIASFGSADAGLRRDGAALPGALAEETLLLEHFKLRDVRGNVIGVAARHLTRTPEAANAAWALAIPGRGTLMLAGSGEAPSAVDAALEADGYVAGSAWKGELDLIMHAGDGSGYIAGTGEFDRLDVRYEETWSVTGVGADGVLRATVELATISRRLP